MALTVELFGQVYLCGSRDLEGDATIGFCTGTSPAVQFWQSESSDCCRALFSVPAGQDMGDAEPTGQ